MKDDRVGVSGMLEDFADFWREDFELLHIPFPGHISFPGPKTLRALGTILAGLAMMAIGPGVWLGSFAIVANVYGAEGEIRQDVVYAMLAGLTVLGALTLVRGVWMLARTDGAR